MEKIPPGRGSCCTPKAHGLTYLRIGSEQHLVGMVNLETVFQQLLLLEHAPEAVSSAELVAMARKFNYIPRSADIEADYAVALRQAYAQYCAGRGPVRTNLDE